MKSKPITTDSDLKRRWDETARQLDALQRDQSTGRQAKIDKVRHDQADIRLAWERVMSQRCRGILTDTTHTDKARACIEDFGKILGIPVATEVVEEGERNDANAADY